VNSNTGVSEDIWGDGEVEEPIVVVFVGKLSFVFDNVRDELFPCLLVSVAVSLFIETTRQETID